MRIVKFIELFRKIKIEKDIKIFFHLATIIKNMHYLYIYYTYIVDQKAWNIAVSFQQSKFYIFRNFSFLLSYTCIPSFQRNLDAKREDIVTIAFKTRFAYIRPTARFFFTGDTTFFFLLYLEIWIMIFGGDTIRDRSGANSENSCKLEWTATFPGQNRE